MNVSVLKMKTDVTDLESSINFVISHGKANLSSYVCVSNVHMCMETFDDMSYRAIVNSADLVIPDGRPISWAQQALGYKAARQVRGQDIMNELCRLSGTQELKIGLYGGSTNELLERVVMKLKIEYPDIQVVYSYPPPFRPLTNDEDNKVVKDINDAEVNVLFVGIGCPKQERWMAEHRGKVRCVMLGVGAAFDFIAGSKKHAPRWVQYIGMEWCFRLLSEPRRLWRRYLVHNPRFIYYFLQQWLLGKKFD